MQRVSRSTGITAALVLIGVSLGCGSDGGTTPTGDNALEIRILGENGPASFTPNPASAGGRAVRFKNETNDTHRITLNDGSITTGDIPPGGTSPTISMPVSGTNYHCSNHPATMVGGAVIGQGDTTPPPCSGIYCSSQ
jgi:plastocyanin